MMVSPRETVSQRYMSEKDQLEAILSNPGKPEDEFPDISCFTSPITTVQTAAQPNDVTADGPDPSHEMI